MWREQRETPISQSSWKRYNCMLEKLLPRVQSDRLRWQQLPCPEWGLVLLDHSGHGAQISKLKPEQGSAVGNSRNYLMWGLRRVAPQTPGEREGHAAVPRYEGHRASWSFASWSCFTQEEENGVNVETVPQFLSAEGSWNPPRFSYSVQESDWPVAPLLWRTIKESSLFGEEAGTHPWDNWSAVPFPGCHFVNHDCSSGPVLTLRTCLRPGPSFSESFGLHPSQDHYFVFTPYIVPPTLALTHPRTFQWLRNMPTSKSRLVSSVRLSFFSNSLSCLFLRDGHRMLLQGPMK